MYAFNLEHQGGISTQRSSETKPFYMGMLLTQNIRGHFYPKVIRNYALLYGHDLYFDHYEAFLPNGHQKLSPFIYEYAFHQKIRGYFLPKGHQKLGPWPFIRVCFPLQNIMGSGTFFGLEKYGADRFLAFGPKDCGAGSFFVPNEWRIVFWLEITEQAVSCAKTLRCIEVL